MRKKTEKKKLNFSEQAAEMLLKKGFFDNREWMEQSLETHRILTEGTRLWFGNAYKVKEDNKS